MTAPKKTLADLVAVMAALRTPVTGCPWDLEQSFATIAPYTIEEAYEVVDAIERRDLADLKEELGDLLLQVVYHSRLAEEENAFALPDVVDAITAKMIRRHPHVFGDDAARSAGAAKGFWEKIKAEEKAAKAVERARLGVASKSGTSMLDDVPANLPAMTAAIKLTTKAAQVGFDWPDVGPAFDKVREELAELQEAVASGETAHTQEEFGDLLFIMANVARHLDIDPDTALRAANQKFRRRFRSIEDALAADGRRPADSSLAEMDRLWDEAKAKEQAK